MTNFIKTPNLPKEKVKKLICGKTDETILSFIKSLGIEILQSDLNYNVDKRISNHADISVHHLGEQNIIVDSSQIKLCEVLKNEGMNVSFSDSNIVGEYPFDCRLNFARVGDVLFGKTEVADRKLSDYAQKHGVKFVNTKQGYAKCSTLVLDNKCFITDDVSIYNAGVNEDFDCLFVEKGDVYLDGYNYGFIGGSAGLIDKKHVIFLGDIRRHRNFCEIDTFLKTRNFDYSYIKNVSLTDIGGIVVLG